MESLTQDISIRLVALGTLQTRYVLEGKLNDENLSQEEFDENNGQLKDVME